MKLQDALAETYNRQERDLRHKLAKKLWECRRDNWNLKLYARCLFDILVSDANVSCVDCGISDDCSGPVREGENSPRSMFECVYRKATLNSFRTHLENDKEIRRAFMSMPANMVSAKEIIEHGKKFDFGPIMSVRSVNDETVER